MCKSLRGWWRESFEDAVHLAVQLADVGSKLTDCRLALCEPLLDGTEATAETPSCTADCEDDHSPECDNADNDRCGVRGGAPCRVATFRFCGMPVRRWRPWLGGFANRPPTVPSLNVAADI